MLRVEQERRAHEEEAMTNRLNQQDANLRQRQHENSMFMQAQEMNNLLDRQEAEMNNRRGPGGTPCSPNFYFGKDFLLHRVFNLKVHLLAEIQTEAAHFRAGQEDPPSPADRAVHLEVLFRDRQDQATRPEIWAWGVLRDPSIPCQVAEEHALGAKKATVPPSGVDSNWL